MSSTTATRAPGGSTRTVERALALLSEVCQAEALTLTDCARRTGLPPSTTLRLLRSLEGLGFVRRSADGCYGAGPRIVQLGATTLGRSSLVRLATPALRRIVAATGESAYLSLPSVSGTAVYVAVVEGTRSVRHASWVGRSVVTSGLAIGTVLGGETPPAGYVAERDQIEPDVSAIVAPVRHPGGVVAALSVLGPTYRIDEATLEEYGVIVAEEAARLSASLGAGRRLAKVSDTSEESR